jgi:hypothetical protein
LIIADEATRYEITRLSRKKKLKDAELLYTARLLIQRDIAFRNSPAHSGYSAQTAQTLYTSPNQIRTQLAVLFDAWQSASTTIESAYLWNNRLLLIHPFPDGNGRVSRIYLAALAMRHSCSLEHSMSWVALLDSLANRALFLRAQQAFVDFKCEARLRELAACSWKQIHHRLA